MVKLLTMVLPKSPNFQHLGLSPKIASGMSLIHSWMAKVSRVKWLDQTKKKVRTKTEILCINSQLWWTGTCFYVRVYVNKNSLCILYYIVYIYDVYIYIRIWHIYDVSIHTLFWLVLNQCVLQFCGSSTRCISAKHQLSQVEKNPPPAAIHGRSFPPWKPPQS